ncbi:MAG: S41 family peptidase [Pseudomonadota bacterium]
MPLRPLTLIAILLSIVTGIFLGVLGYERWSTSKLNSADLASFGVALREVQSNYVEDLSDSELLTSALRGLVQQLDPHSSYLDADALEALETEATGRYGGVGLELGVRGGRHTVISPVDSSPAARAGVESGDQLLAIDDWRLGGQHLSEVSRRLRGEPGSDVRLRLARGERTFELKLEREVISLGSVTGRWQTDSVIYVRITQFQTDTDDEFRRTVRRLLAEPDHESVAGLILDLRNNPGGVLQSSVAVADELLESGVIVTTDARHPSRRSRFVATGGDLLEGAPVAVLINGGSASAAEIVAGALKDQGRAVLVGTRSYGKGSVQSLVTLDEKRAVKLTTAYYRTPKGGSIHRRGIAPDVYFDDQTLETADQSAAEREAQLLNVALGQIHKS